MNTEEYLSEFKADLHKKAKRFRELKSHYSPSAYEEIIADTQEIIRHAPQLHGEQQTEILVSGLKEGLQQMTLVEKAVSLKEKEESFEACLPHLYTQIEDFLLGI